MSDSAISPITSFNTRPKFGHKFAIWISYPILLVQNPLASKKLIGVIFVMQECYQPHSAENILMILNSILISIRGTSLSESVDLQSMIITGNQSQITKLKKDLP